MKNFILILLSLAIGIISYAQDKKPKCYKFKTGSFLTVDSKGESEKLDSVYYIRDNNFQTEYLIKNGKLEQEFKLKIIWINDCKYILRKTTQINNSKKLIKGDVLCKIIETGEDYYIVKAKMKGGKWLEIKMVSFKFEEE